jgi:hypothetical protein
MERRGRDVLTEFEKEQQEELRKQRLQEELYAWRGPNGEMIPRSKLPRIVAGIIAGSEPDPREEITRQVQQSDQSEDQTAQVVEAAGSKRKEEKPPKEPPKGPAIHRSPYTGLKKIIHEGENPWIYAPPPSSMIESQTKVQRQEEKRPIIPPSKNLDELLKKMREKINPTSE